MKWFLCCLLPMGVLWAKNTEKDVKPLTNLSHPVKTVLKEGYKIHLARNFAQEAEKELEKRTSHKKQQR